MITTIKKFFLSAAALSIFAVPVLAPVAVHAETIQKGLNNGTCLTVNGTGNDCPAGSDTEGKLNEIIKLVINIFSVVVGLVAVIMIIVGGLKYITSGGDSGNVTGAKNTILYAIVGLIVVALAQFIVRYVLNKAGGIAT